MSIQLDPVEYPCAEIHFKFLIVAYLCLRNGEMLSVYLFLKKPNNLDCIDKENLNMQRDTILILIFSQYLANIWLFLYR